MRVVAQPDLRFPALRTLVGQRLPFEFGVLGFHFGPETQRPPVAAESQFVRRYFRRVAKLDGQTFPALEAQFAADDPAGKGFDRTISAHHYGCDNLNYDARFLSRFAVSSVPAAFAVVHETAG